MMTFSLCMIVKNEEAVLARCLDSIQDLMDHDREFAYFLQQIGADSEQITNAETSIKYSSYIQKEEEMEGCLVE